MTKKQLPVMSKDGNAEEAQKTAERLVIIYQDKKIDLPIANGKALNVEKLEQWIDTKSVQKDMVENSFGFGLLLMKKYIGDGMFNAWLEKKGLGKRSAQEAMKVTEMLCKLSDVNARRVARLPKGKQNALATAPFIMLEDLLDNDEITDEMSREQMRDIIRLEKKAADLATKLDTAIQKQNELKDQLNNKQPTSRFPEFVDNLRHESASQSYRIDLCVDDMQAMFNELVAQEGSLKSSDVEGDRNMRVAYTSLYHNLNGAIGRAYTLLSEMRGQLDESITGTLTDNDILFKKDEALIAAKNRNLLLLEHQHEKLLRENNRNSKKPRRGRKA